MTFIILALSGILLQSFSKAFVILKFEMNRDYISKNLCVKKDEIKNCCKGKCQLKKEIEKDEKNNPSLPANNLKEKVEVQYFSAIKKINFFSRSKKTELNSPYLLSEYVSPHFSVFHPPQA
jgi:hypothetical protein